MKKKKVLISIIVVEIIVVIFAIGLIVWLSLPKNTLRGENAPDNSKDPSWGETGATEGLEKDPFGENEDTTPTEPMPWDLGGKQPDEYTWEEYEALTAEQQMEFFYWFGSTEAFDQWMNRANPQETTPTEVAKMPWDQGGKQPDAYTWEEYEALSAEQQMAFFNWFGSAKAFDEWMNRVKPQEQETVPAGDAMPWENGGKQPDEYTWEEYEALTAEQQMEFYYWFESPEAFDEWMNRVKPEETDPAEPMPWEQGGKQPNEYTWEEYEALTAEQQMAFYYWFESAEAFDAWMVAAQNP